MSQVRKEGSQEVQATRSWLSSQNRALNHDSGLMWWWLMLRWRSRQIISPEMYFTPLNVMRQWIVWMTSVQKSSIRLHKVCWRLDLSISRVCLRGRQIASSHPLKDSILTDKARICSTIKQVERLDMHTSRPAHQSTRDPKPLKILWSRLTCSHNR